MSPSSKKAMLVGIAGTTLQWYDFVLFGYFAPIIAATYFPEGNHIAALLNTFGVFAVGYLLAPIGSIIFGYIGDKYGRKPALTMSILGMAIPTALISIVPGYLSIGVLAPILITLLRITQGFVASAEFTGSAIFLVEHASSKHKALYGCLTSVAYNFGSIIAGLAASFFTASFMPSWGWRIAFAITLIAGLLIFYLRTHVKESPEYQAIEEYTKPKWPFLMAIQEVPFAIIGVIGIAWLAGIVTFGTYVFTSTYLHSYLHLSISHVTLMITLALVFEALLEPLIAIISDKIGYVKIISIGLVGILLFSIPIFQLLSTAHFGLIMAGLIWMSILIAFTYAPLNTYMVLLFPQHYRYSGFGIAFNLGISLFGATAPLVMVWLINITDSLIAPAFYYMVGAIIGLFALTLCEKSRHTADESLEMVANV